MRTIRRGPRAGRFTWVAVALTLAVASPTGAFAADLDGDGFEDTEDNCVARANGLSGAEQLVQRDTDLDGIGNVCDSDFNDDGLVGSLDFRLMLRVFGSEIGQPAYDPDADMNGDGSVNGPDFQLFARSFGSLPGPSGLACAGSSPCPHQNVLILIADDVGVDNIGMYRDRISSEPPQAEHVPPNTPNIDALGAAGLGFHQAWANPLCSTTRATLLTGLYSFRTGVGGALPGGNPQAFGVEPGMPSIARLLGDAGYQTGAFGKWHLSAFCHADRTSEGGCAADDPRSSEVEGYDLEHPVEMGFDYFEGTSNIQDYCDWPKIRVARNPDHSVQVLENAASTTYATTDTVNSALAWISQASQPSEENSAPRWFAWVGFNAAHKPLHRADASDPCPMESGGLSPEEQYDSMVERLDDEIGRLLAGIPAKVRSQTVIVFLGDNGTTRDGVTPPFDPDRAKNSVYQGGINVPFIVKGRMVTARTGGETSSALVNSTDLFATLASLEQLALPPEVAKDSRSFAPHLANPGSSKGRSSAYAERFRPNGFGPYSSHDRALRDDRFKLIRFEGVGFEGYDLSTDDPFELDNLIATPDPQQRDRLYCLAQEMSALRGETWSFDDFDGDGVSNAVDNCSAIANPTQCNSNSLRHCLPGSHPDDLGNLCDPDFNCDGSADEEDHALFGLALGSVLGDPGYDPDIDMNCDGSIDSGDESLLLRFAVGPSGCGERIPCPTLPPQRCP